MDRAFKRILSVSLVLLCLAIAHQSKTSQQTSSPPKQDLSTWQTVSLDGKGIKFKVPPDWRHDDFDLEKKNENFTMQQVDWQTPNKDTPNKQDIGVLITTYHTGFVSFGRKAASREEILEEEFELVTRSTQGKDSSLFSEVKKIKVSGVEGVFRVMRVNFEDKDIGPREGINWTGYRFYQGNAQEIDISISANPKSDALLRTIFGTLELEQDRDAIPKP